MLSSQSVPMKAKLESLAPKRKNRSFLCYEVETPVFPFNWHYHPEYELTLIIRGEGKRLVGDRYEQFEKHDLVLIGPLLPHTWVTEKANKQNNLAIVIQFSLEFMQPLLQYNEMTSIKKLLQRADSGIQFFDKKEKATRLIQKMIDSNEFEQMILLIQVLQSLSSCKMNYLSSANFKPLKGDKSEHRINKVFQYVQKEYKHTLSLSKAASLIYLSESAFCKFFKRMSGKTFSDYVNEIRIAHSCNRLIETDESIFLIAQKSGFESTTYFNRVFFRKKGITPSEFRKISHKRIA